MCLWDYFPMEMFARSGAGRKRVWITLGKQDVFGKVAGRGGSVSTHKDCRERGGVIKDVKLTLQGYYATGKECWCGEQPRRTGHHNKSSHSGFARKYNPGAIKLVKSEGIVEKGKRVGGKITTQTL